MDAIDELPVFPTRTPVSRAGLALRFAVLCSLTALASGCLTAALLYWNPDFGSIVGVPSIFVLTTLLLAASSYSLQRSTDWVRIEKQKPFRSCLIGGILLGICFTGVQSFALATLFPDDRSTELAQTGVIPFTIGVVSMHALHVITAQLALSWITVQAFNDRYDHEFFRPVTYCAWFWHFLGGVWLSLLVIIGIAL